MRLRLRMTKSRSEQAMKQHGLWRFYREARTVQQRLGLRWWVEDEAPRIAGMIRALHSGYGRTLYPSNATAIMVCARRYMRMYRAQVRTVGEWNALCLRIAHRAGYTHASTLRACLLPGVYRDKSVVRFRPDFPDDSAPRVLATWPELKARAERIAEARKKNNRSIYEIRYEERLCAVCGSSHKVAKNYARQRVRSEQDRTLSVIEDTFGWRFYLCFKHRMAYGKLLKAQERESEARRLINQVKRKIREGTHQSARTDQRPELHHGGGDQRGC